MVGRPPRPPPAAPIHAVRGPLVPVVIANNPAVIPTESKPVFNDLWSSIWGRKTAKGEVRVQNTRPVRKSLREDLMEIKTTLEEQAANGLGVTNGTQLNDGSIGTAPHIPLHSYRFLSSGNAGLGLQ